MVKSKEYNSKKKSGLSVLLIMIFSMSTIEDALSQTYEEAYRPQFHFSPIKNWINDPCGTVFHNGIFHLYYQYNPNGDQWGNMSWGHAVSSDMVHWSELPVAMAPDPMGAIFSGSAVVDVNNTAGFGAGALIAIFTHAGSQQHQSLAYSTDNGNTWQKYSENPVLKNQGVADFRDPQVFWHDQTSRWIMALAVSNRIQIFTSPNLKTWSFASEFGANVGAHGGVWECPDLFPLKIEGTNEEKWAMIVSLNPGGPAGAGTQYFLGDFDGTTFTLDDSFEQALTVQVPDGIVFEDFEDDNYGTWTVAGSAFGSSPAQGTLANQQEVSGYEGQRLVNSYLDGDDTKGTLTSPLFIISSDYINFLIGGGERADAGIRLIVNGAIVESATGSNNERLQWQSWDVKALQGESAHIEIIDEATGSWGHINVDHIVFSNLPVENKMEAFWADFGPDHYASRSWYNSPETQGRVLVSWMSNWSYAGAIPTFPWRGGMTLPRAIKLKRFGEGIRLIQKPLDAIETLREGTFVFEQKNLNDANAFMQENNIKGMKYELRFSLYPNASTDAGIKIRSNGSGYTKVGFRATANEVYLDRSQSGLMPYGTGVENTFQAVPISSGDSVDFRIYVDHSSVEVFINGGERVITSLIFPNGLFEGLEFYSDSEKVIVENFEFHPLKSAWGHTITSVHNFSDLENEIHVYPNPSSGKWTIDSTDYFTSAELIASDGSKSLVTLSKDVKNRTVVEAAENLTSGVYLLRLYTNTKLTKTVKLLVVK